MEAFILRMIWSEIENGELFLTLVIYEVMCNRPPVTDKLLLKRQIWGQLKVKNNTINIKLLQIQYCGIHR